MHLTFTCCLLLLLSIIRPAAAQVMYALHMPTDYRAFYVLSFDITTPNQIYGQHQVTGLGRFDLIGLEVQPGTGRLYGFGLNGQVQLFEVNPTTGAATPIGTPISLPGISDFNGFCFDPVSGDIRVITTQGTNYRLSPVDGTLLGTDAPVQYAANDPNAGQVVGIHSLAFDINQAGASTVRLFGLDYLNSRLVTLDNPADGTLRSLGNLGVDLSMSGGTLSALAIGNDANGQRTFYMVRSELVGSMSGSFGMPSLYSVNATTGQAALLGPILGGMYVFDLAIPNTIISASRDRINLVRDIAVAPNPAQGSTSLQFNLSRPSQTELTVFDNLGRTVATVQASLPSGTNSLRWDAGTARPGLYLLRLAVNGQPAATRRVVVE
ncbi:DUF4394 domain-containing protein [Hymenobacter sp. ASUV-10]|uniref:DUF4394 domain-containing protein n=1 Tax=Hymenobacter aranciens TaxID=3063996 RepID=A0ABT9BK85_9BACT|nr:DUF4394 domain-containing protein [Hymenobacter sp. ASUV-10]MDO7876943.1 DUF4394 domain-containing protein [Hymenobacter sp. ASUV-10]